MEFKEFKNENNKILKEYWLTQSEWDALDKTTVQEGDIYHIVGTIDKGDLSADVNASLAKADSSLQKPTETLAKESFVKVGIDGKQKFDESAYVVAPSTGGTVGQVLKKTANGTEWANESGGGKLYLHKVTIHDSADTKLIKLLFVNSNSNKITNITQNLVNTAIECNASPTTPPTYYECGSVPIYITNGNIEASGFASYPFNIMNTISVNIELATAAIEDDVTEL